MKFVTQENEFNLYMLEQNIGKGAKNNYRSWLRFIEKHHDLSNLSPEIIDKIIKNLENTVDSREVYTRKDDISNFKSALRKFYSFLNDLQKDDFEYNLITENISTDKKQVILSRLGQGNFRSSLLNKYGGKCVISNCTQSDLLVASHIKPWKFSNNEERLNPNNGFLLTPNYDKLFDKGYISINPKTIKIEYSSNLSKEVIAFFDLRNISLNIEINDEQIAFIEYHYNNIFIS